MSDHISSDWDFLLELSKKGTTSCEDRSRLDPLLNSYELSTDNTFEIKFFRALVAVSILSRAAFQPSLSGINPNPAPTEDLVPASKKSSDVIIEALAFKEWEIVEEALRIIKSQKRRLHPWALPALLDHGQSHTNQYPLFAATFGERAIWLANFRSEWRWWSQLHQDSAETITEDELIYWIQWQRLRGHLEMMAIDRLAVTDRIKLLQEISQRPMDRDAAIGQRYLKSSRAKERKYALSILLQLDTQEYRQNITSMEDFARQFITIRKAVIYLNQKVPRPSGFSFSTHDLPQVMPKDEVFWRLLTFLKPDQIFKHIDFTPEVICNQIVEKDRLKPLCHILVEALTRHRSPVKWQEAMMLQWLKIYPDKNTILAPFEKIVKVLDHNVTQVLITALIEDTTEYFTTKLLIVVANTKQYVNRDLSIALMDKIFRLLTTNLSRTGVNDIGEVLQHAQYLLDPRVNNSIIANWVEVDYRYQRLAKIMLEFRDTIKRRSILLASIIEDVS
ncbi:MAG: hypothetical protein HKN76_12000 [Saprospiraceae bacterium]|nr:hypothetical protein [Saprospiraceae bacterium]